MLGTSGWAARPEHTANVLGMGAPVPIMSDSATYRESLDPASDDLRLRRLLAVLATPAKEACSREFEARLSEVVGR